MITERTQSYSRRATSLTLGLLMGFTSLCSVASAQPGRYQQAQTRTTAVRQSYPRYAQNWAPDTLMITPAANVTGEELAKSIEDADCHLVNTITMGKITIIVLKTPKGKLAQTEQLLKKDKHIGLMQRNYKMDDCANPPSDPTFVANKDTFLTLIKAPKAWDLGARGGGQRIAIFDSGCQASTGDLAGKTAKGYDATTLDAQIAAIGSPLLAAAGVALPGVGLIGGLLGGLGLQLGSSLVNPGARTDDDKDPKRKGHGTAVATVAAGSENGVHGVGVAPDAQIYPVRDGTEGNGGDDMAIIQGLAHIAIGGPKIVNISQGPLGDPSSRPIDHLVFRAFHGIFGGIIFVSAGNHSEQLGGGQLGYLNVVAMTDPSGRFVENDGKGNGSAFGTCVTFTAQGSQVWTVDKFDEDVPVNGTSFSSPTCAGVAALIWSANSNLSNTQVEYIMKKTAYIPVGVTYDVQKYGYGIPDAEAAVKMAQGG